MIAWLGVVLGLLCFVTGLVGVVRGGSTIGWWAPVLMLIGFPLMAIAAVVQLIVVNYAQL